MDIAGPKYDAHGKPFYLIALVDNHSKYVLCRIVRSIVTRVVIDFLDSAFAIFGLCAKFTTDNEVQFTSTEFSDFLRQRGITHIRSAVYNPQANGGIERVNRNFKKLFQTFQSERVSPEELQTSLQYVSPNNFEVAIRAFVQVPTPYEAGRRFTFQRPTLSGS